MRPAALGASIAALAVSTGSWLAPQAASALDFTFSFAGVTGLIENLVEGQNICNNAAPNSPACFVKVTNSGRPSSGRPRPSGVGTYRWYDFVPEEVGNFTVLRSGGSFFLVSARWRGNCDASLNCDPGTNEFGDFYDSNLLFCDPTPGYGFLGCDQPPFGPSVYPTGIQSFCISAPVVCETDQSEPDGPSGGPVAFAAVQPSTPSSSSVPGPLPLLGAAAFSFSRKLRNRIKVTRTTAPTRPAGSAIPGTFSPPVAPSAALQGGH